MKKHTIIKLSNFWSTGSLKNDVTRILDLKTAEGFEIVSVSFGVNLWMKPTAFITICKEE